MKFEKLYQETFSQLHSSTQIRWEDFEQMNAVKKPMRHFVMIAAIVAVLAALSAAAVATDFFGLRQVLLPQQGKVNVLDEDGIVIPGETEYKDFISLAGYSDTPETRALAEWEEFLDGYDQDGAILSAIGNQPTGLEEQYGEYLVYTQEMADKLEEIAAKYGLRLHRAMGLIFPEEWAERIGPFLGENAAAYTGYAYEDGTFSFDGDAVLPEYGLADYQFHRSVRGSFEQVTLNIGDVSQYEAWVYETDCGVPVTLALSESKGLILADLGDSFVTVNVLAGTETPEDDVFSSGPFYREDLERLAECFDFTVLTPAVPLDVESFSVQPPYADDEPAADWEWDNDEEYRWKFYDETGMEAEPALAFYREFVRNLAEDRREALAEMLAYPRRLSLPDGEYLVTSAEEFLEYYDRIFTEELRMQFGSWRDIPDDLRFETSRDTPALAGNGILWFGLGDEDGSIRVYEISDGQGYGVRTP